MDIKISLKQGKKLVLEGKITETQLQDWINDGTVAGYREKESFRIKGVTIPITTAFPTPSVTLPVGTKLTDLDEANLEKVNAFKTDLAEKIRPVYEEVRARHTEKVMVAH